MNREELLRQINDWHDNDEHQKIIGAVEALEGFEGSGYDWESLAKVFLEEKTPDLIGTVKFDSGSSMFCAYSENAAALREFIAGFKNACENKALITDLFSRAELD